MATGLVTPKCYAAALGDCDGGPVTGEHYISRALLDRIEQLGDEPRLVVSGLSWIADSRVLGKDSLIANVLCERHNNMLWPLDAEACKLFDVLVAVQRDEHVGARAIAGEQIERWALKLLGGMIASGNAKRRDGVRMKQALPNDYLTVLFGGAMPDGCGFRLFVLPVARHKSHFDVTINTHRPDSPEEGRIYGITIKILGLYFATLMCPLVITKERPDDPDQSWYRPRGINLEGKALVDLGWSRTPSNEIIHLARETAGAA